MSISTSVGRETGHNASVIRANKPQSLFLFDLGGTISDPITGIAKPINYALEALGFDEVSESRIARYIGIPIDETLVDLCETESGKLVNRLVIKYRERFSAVGYSENVLYPGGGRKVFWPTGKSPGTQ
ncbi:MAG: HAD hydrolase-like protein [Gammaproteobacteria bacterium]|nr:HAD hydrolase-like protein [Gammaproteobacteria bacterium]MYD01372.1 HAD hydrolase-like protein [Gammaproteobacteria bacterium]MYI24692.1 HAD hydrolase-like protein [Gammaproteobacteria bacterium]